MNSFAGDIMTNSLSPQLLAPTDRQNRVEQLRNLIIDQVLASSADGILFSGGLDTSVLAAIAASHGRRLQAGIGFLPEGFPHHPTLSPALLERHGDHLVII